MSVTKIHSHREMGGKAPWDGGPFIINPNIHLISRGYLLGISVYPQKKGLQQGVFPQLGALHPKGPPAFSL